MANEIFLMREAVRSFCQLRDWDQFHTPKDLAIGLSTEANELLEVFRFRSEKECQQLVSEAEGREAIGDELADVLFFLLRFADRFDFDLQSALESKLKKNAEKYPLESSRGNNRKYDKL